MDIVNHSKRREANDATQLEAKRSQRYDAVRILATIVNRPVINNMHATVTSSNILKVSFPQPVASKLDFDLTIHNNITHERWSFKEEWYNYQPVDTVNVTLMITCQSSHTGPGHVFTSAWRVYKHIQDNTQIDVCVK